MSCPYRSWNARRAPASSEAQARTSWWTSSVSVRRPMDLVLRGAHRPDALLDGGLHEAVVVFGDEPVDAALEQRAQDRVEGFVRLAEVHARAGVAHVFQARPAGGPRPERLADGVIAPRLARLRLCQPLPRASDASGQQVAWHAEMAVPDPTLAGRVAPVEVLDSHVAVLDDPVPMSPEERPDLPRRRLDDERE